MLLRSGPNKFKPSTLAREELNMNGEFHEANFDVIILEILVNKFVKDVVLSKHIDKFEKLVQNQQVTEEISNDSRWEVIKI